MGNDSNYNCINIYVYRINTYLRKQTKMYAYEDKDGEIMFIYPKRELVKMCFPNMKPTDGKIIQVKVTEIKKRMEEIKGIDVYEMAKEFHRIYEEEADKMGWGTQDKCKTTFDKLPKSNQATMLRTCARMTEWTSNNQEDV